MTADCTCGGRFATWVGNPGGHRWSCPAVRPTEAQEDAAILDYTETALTEAWMVLRDIAAGHKYPARYAANLLRAHGHNLDEGDRMPTAAESIARHVTPRPVRDEPLA